MPIANCTHSVLRHCRGLDQRSTNRQATKRPQWSQPVGVWARKSKARHAAQCGPPVPLYAVGIIFWGGCQNCKEIGQCKKIWWRGSPSHHLILAKHIQCGKAAKVPDGCSDIFICNLCIVFMSKKMIKNDTIWHPCTKKWHQGRAVNFGLVNNGKHKWKINNTGLVSCDGEFITYHIHKIYIDRNVDVITVFWKHIEKPTCLELVWHHLSLTYLQFFCCGAMWSGCVPGLHPPKLAQPANVCNCAHGLPGQSGQWTEHQKEETRPTKTILRGDCSPALCSSSCCCFGPHWAQNIWSDAGQSSSSPGSPHGLRYGPSAGQSLQSSCRQHNPDSGSQWTVHWRSEGATRGQTHIGHYCISALVWSMFSYVFLLFWLCMDQCADPRWISSVFMQLPQTPDLQLLV